MFAMLPRTLNWPQNIQEQAFTHCSNVSFFWLYQELNESQYPSGPSLYKAINLYLSVSGLSYEFLRSFLGLIACVGGKTEPKILVS